MAYASVPPIMPQSSPPMVTAVISANTPAKIFTTTLVASLASPKMASVEAVPSVTLDTVESPDAMTGAI